MGDIDCIDKLEDTFWAFIQEDISWLGGMIFQNDLWTKEEITRNQIMAEANIRWIKTIKEFTEINNLINNAIEIIEMFIDSIKSGNLEDARELISSTPLINVIRMKKFESRFPGIVPPGEIILHPYTKKNIQIIKEFLRTL